MIFFDAPMVSGSLPGTMLNSITESNCYGAVAGQIKLFFYGVAILCGERGLCGLLMYRFSTCSQFIETKFTEAKQSSSNSYID